MLTVKREREREREGSGDRRRQLESPTPNLPCDAEWMNSDRKTGEKRQKSGIPAYCALMPALV